MSEIDPYGPEMQELATYYEALYVPPAQRNNVPTDGPDIEYPELILNESELETTENFYKYILRQRQQPKNFEASALVLGVTANKNAISVEEMNNVFMIRKLNVSSSLGKISLLQRPLTMGKQQLSYPNSKISRLRDGGTTTIDSRLGQIHIPARHYKQPAMLNDQPIVPITRLINVKSGDN